jgi:hypothetical protein
MQHEGEFWSCPQSRARLVGLESNKYTYTGASTSRGRSELHLIGAKSAMPITNTESMAKIHGSYGAYLKLTLVILPSALNKRKESLVTWQV